MQRKLIDIIATSFHLRSDGFFSLKQPDLWQLWRSAGSRGDLQPYQHLLLPSRSSCTGQMHGSYPGVVLVEIPSAEGAEGLSPRLTPCKGSMGGCLKRPREAWDRVKSQHTQLQPGEEPGRAHPELWPPTALVNVTAALYSS